MGWKAFLCFAIFLSGARVDAQDAIKVGEVNQISGAIGEYGVSCHNGIKLAIDQAIAGGGVLGKQIALLTEDNQSKAGQTSTIVRKFVTQDKVVAIVGDLTSSATLVGGPIAQAAMIPLVTPLATHPKVTEIGDYIFRVCFIDEFQGRIMARFALENLKLKNAAILTDIIQAYSFRLSGFFKQSFMSGAGSMDPRPNYATAATDFRAQLTSIKAAGPEVVFVPGYYP